MFWYKHSFWHCYIPRLGGKRTKDEARRTREEELSCSVYFEQVGVMVEERFFAEYPVITLEQNEFNPFIL